MRYPRAAIALLAALVLMLGTALWASSCNRKPQASKAQKAQAKQAKDHELLALAYPKSTGTQPRTIETTYDGAADRTLMTLRLTDVRLAGSGAVNASNAILNLSSSHKGQVRAQDDPEGSIDGSLDIQTKAAGMLAYAGPPGTLTADGKPMPLKEASKKNTGLKSSPGEETVRFKVATKDLVAAANASAVSLTIGTVQVELTPAALADLREFAARLNPKP